MNMLEHSRNSDLFGNAGKSKRPLMDRFGLPPFSVLDAKQGEWQKRKKKWIRLGIQGEVGRGLSGEDFMNTSTVAQGSIWHGGQTDASRRINNITKTGTSIFDPVLCECIYRWFSAPGYQVVDPFAGGSVRGIVASKIGLNYWGCDLRQEQIDANMEQANKINPESVPVWVCADATSALKNAPKADLVFSCPPYGNLEKYGDDAKDLSNMEWDDFQTSYRRIIRRSVRCLKPNRFACFVVGNFRDNQSHYRNFVGLTVDMFQSAGAHFYNDAVLTTAVGSASLRASYQFDIGRKFAKVHQNVLIFCKGNWRAAVSDLKSNRNAQ